MSKRVWLLPLLLMLTLGCSGCVWLAAQDKPAGDAARYDKLVRAVVARYQLPGIAVGVIEHGNVVYKHVHGLRPPGKPVDSDTLFKIASNSKAMTVTLLARLVQQGKLRWDDPVTKYLPDFRMHDPWVTRNMQVADLLSHDSGLALGAGDLMLWPMPNDFTPEDVMHGLRYMQPAYSFRSGYHYDNTLYVVAGMVAAAAGGQPYAELLRQELFAPLGMQRCRIGSWNRADTGNVARPHVKRNGEYVAVPAAAATVQAATMDAAGGVRCSLDAMLTWAGNWLTPSAEQLAWLSPAQRRAEWAPRVAMPISERRHAWDGTLLHAYARGWRLADVDGRMTVSHTGTLSGMYSALTLLPFQRSGFVFLINADAPDARRVLNEVLTKQFTAPEQARSVASYADELARARRARHAAHVPDTLARQPARPAQLQSWLGTWRDPWFGDVTICAQANRVRFVSAKSPALQGRVMRVGTRYLVQWDGHAAEAWLDFPPDRDGVLHMSRVDPDADFSWDYADLAFTRQAACE